MGELWENYGRTVVAVNYRSIAIGWLDLTQGLQGAGGRQGSFGANVLLKVTKPTISPLLIADWGKKT
jgi:hypothetical protein